jgi:hypothetical protein
VLASYTSKVCFKHRILYVSNLIRLGVAWKTSCDVIEMSHVATSEKDKSLDISIFLTTLTA